MLSFMIGTMEGRSVSTSNIAGYFLQTGIYTYQDGGGDGESNQVNIPMLLQVIRLYIFV